MARLLPLLAGGFVAGVVLADLGCLAVSSSFGLGVAAFVAGIRVSHPRCKSILAIVVAVGAGGLALAVRLEESARSPLSGRLEATVEATVCSQVDGRSWIAVELCEVQSVADARDAPGAASVPPRLMWTIRRQSPESDWLAARLPGDRIRVRLRVRPLTDLRNPGARDRSRALERRGVGGRAALTDPLLRAQLPELDRSGPGRWIALATRDLRARITARLEAAGGTLLAALATGQQRLLAELERDAFRALGVGHLLAVSGLHLALAAGFAYGSTRRILLRFDRLCASRDIRPIALVVGLSCAGLYAALAGWGIPVRRAMVLLLALAAALAGRRAFSGVHALAAAALAIGVAEPWAVFEPGAQLSFAASAALLFAAPERADQDGEPRGRLRAIALAWRTVLRTSATAFVATAPIAVSHGGVAAPLALVANAVMVPWTGLVLLPLSLASATVAALPASRASNAALELAALVGDWTLSGLVRAADLAPQPHQTATPASWAVWLGVAVAFWALCCRSLAARAGLAILLALWLAAAPSPQIAPGPPRVVALDVGLGDAVLVQGQRAAVLVDGGWASRDRADLGASVVVPALRSLGVGSLDIVVATHGDTDHQGGLQAVLRELAVGRLWLPPGGAADPVFASLVEHAERSGVTVEEHSAAEDPVDVGDLHITTLWPPPEYRGSANDRSLVLRVDVAGSCVLLTGDLGGDAERALLESSAKLRCEILKVGHHGSRSSASADFLQVADASVALISAPCGRQALPSRETLNRLRAARHAIWWTGRDGAVFVRLAPEVAVWGWAKRPQVNCLR